MSKRLIPLLLIPLLSSFVGTPVQALDCEWISPLKTNSGKELDVLDEGLLKTPIHREEYEQLVKTIASYNVCMDQKIGKLLSDIASSAMEGADRAQLISTLNKKLSEMKNTNRKIAQQLLRQNQKYAQFGEEVASSNKIIRELIRSLELAFATQLKGFEGVDNGLELKLVNTANQLIELSERLENTDNRIGSGLSDLDRTFSTQLKGLEGVDDELDMKVVNTANQLIELSERLEDTNNRIGTGLSDLSRTLAAQLKGIKGVDNELELKLVNTANQLIELSERLADTDYRIAIGLSNLDRTLATQLKGLEGVDDEHDLKVVNTANQIIELSERLADTDNRMSSGLSNLNEALSDKTIYGVTFTFTMTLIVIILFWHLRKSVVYQRTDLNSNLERMKNEMEEGSTRLDNKLISLIESQLSIEGSKGSHSEEIDHSLALKVADEIVRIQKNTMKMDTKTKGLKQLVASVKRIQDNFSSNGYDIVEMLDQPYDEGLNASVNFILDENLNEKEQVITKIIKPQVNYHNVMIQSAQIEVSKGE
jgi:hypothetical protein